MIVLVAHRVDVALLARGLRADALASAHHLGGRAPSSGSGPTSTSRCCGPRLRGRGRGPARASTTSSSKSRATRLGVLGVARDRDLVAPHEDVHGERVLDRPQQLVVLAEQVHHEVVPRNEDLDLGRRRGGHVTFRVAPDDRGACAAELRRARSVAPQAELVEPHTQLVGPAAEHRREHPEVVAANSQQTAVEVLALELDRRGVPGQHCSFGIVERVQLDEVDGEAGVEVGALGRG